MKVAYINTVAGYNATGRLCEQLALSDAVDGKIFYGRKSYSGKVDNFKFNSVFFNGIHVLSTFIFDNHAFVNKHQTRNLIKKLNEFNPDIIHLHNLHGYYLDVEVLFDYLKQSRIKVVWTFHDCWPFTGHCAHFDGIGCDKWRTECKQCPILNNYPPTFNGNNTSRNYYKKKEVFTSLDVNQMVLVSPSEWLAAKIKDSFLHIYPVKVINNGIDLKKFKYKAISNAKKIELLAIASVWTKMKGLNDLVKLSNLLPADCHLMVIGLSKKQFKLFPNSVTCIERISNQKELINLYNSANYFINFTYEDTFPTVNIEAIACGLPVITYNTGGSVEIINEKTGFVIDKGNFNACLDIISNHNALSPTDCINRSKLFDQQIMVEKYTELYQNLLKSNDCH